MPGKKHVAGATPNEQRQYEHILEDARKSGRYGRRAKEVRSTNGQQAKEPGENEELSSKL